MYEPDSDEEDDSEDGGNKEPSAKLKNGCDVPRRFGEFPLELAGQPLCDIDPYYKDKLTFIVVSKGGAITRYSARPSFFIFSPFHPIRRLALMIFSHWFFNLFIISTILANCYVMMIPETATTSSTEIVFTAIYTFEATVKLVSRGFFIGKAHSPY